jgi:hypothetical protein
MRDSNIRGAMEELVFRHERSFAHMRVTLVCCCDTLRAIIDGFTGRTYTTDNTASTNNDQQRQSAVSSTGALTSCTMIPPIDRPSTVQSQNDNCCEKKLWGS